MTPTISFAERHIASTLSKPIVLPGRLGVVIEPNNRFVKARVPYNFVRLEKLRSLSRYPAKSYAVFMLSPESEPQLLNKQT
jgi:hypothetical protein